MSVTLLETHTRGREEAGTRRLAAARTARDRPSSAFTLLTPRSILFHQHSCSVPAVPAARLEHSCNLPDKSRENTGRPFQLGHNSSCVSPRLLRDSSALYGTCCPSIKLVHRFQPVVKSSDDRTMPAVFPLFESSLCTWTSKIVERLDHHASLFT
jgi:hypothetical protein